MLNDYSFKHDFLEDEKPAAEGWLEGYLFPDTYEVYKGNACGRFDAINKMLNNFGNKYDADIQAGAAESRPLECTISVTDRLARRARGAARRRARAHRGRHLQPTEQSRPRSRICRWTRPFCTASAAPSGKLSHEDLQSDSAVQPVQPIEGLPPGPICNPGYASLYAASHPEDNNYYYYVAMPDGSHLFASSYEEHERNIEASNQAQAQAASASADTTTTEATGE